MTSPAASPTSPHRQSLLDTLMLLFCGIIVAGRCQIHETTFDQWQIRTTPATYIGSGGTISVISFAGLIFAAAWLWRLSSNQQQRTLMPRTLWLGWFGLFTAAILSTVAASNHHAALIGTSNILSGSLLALIAAATLTTPARRRIILCVIAATGISMAYRCWEQATYEIPASIQNYRENPQALLAAQGIEPGTYAARQFEERILSQDIGGYFSISNSAASFLILSIFVTAALLAQALGKKPQGQQWLWILLTAALLAMQIVAIALTKSKGGIAALGIAAVLAAVLFLIRRWAWHHRRLLLVIALLFITVTVIGIIAYGTTHGRLPSASMWVRWQYWQASGTMIAHHGWLGAGAENFGSYYTLYMDPAAPEVVKDPHCFPLALWTQLGILGLISFFTMLAAAVITLTKAPPASSATNNNDTNISAPTPTSHSNASPPARDFLTQWWWLAGLVIGFGALMIRLMLTDLSGCSTQLERQGVYITSFVMPTMIWLAAFFLFWRSGLGHEALSSPSATLIMSCGLLGFLCHNTLDFAIFQPGILCCLAILLGLLIASRHNHTAQASTPPPSPIRRHAFTAVTGCALILYLWLAVAPTRQAGSLINQAQFIAPRNPQHAVELTKQAARLTPLDPAPNLLGAKILLWQWQQYPQQDQLLNRAADLLQQAKLRDPANQRYGTLLGEAYYQAGAKRDTHYYQRALEEYQYALARYPGKSELLLNAAQAAEKIDQPDLAQQYYQQAWHIEQNFLAQQKQMWHASKEILPRLKTAQWQLLRSKVKTSSVQEESSRHLTNSLDHKP